MREETRNEHPGRDVATPPRDPTIAGTERPRLRLLSNADDYEVADGSTDIRGWRVFDAEANAIGTVHDLVADLNAKQVRYVDLKLDADVPAGTGGRHVLVPIGPARLSADVDAVTLRDIRAADLARLPQYEHQDIDRGYERRLRSALLGADDAGASPDEDFYRHAHFDTSLLWSSRTGGPRTTTYAVVERRAGGGTGTPGSRRG